MDKVLIVQYFFGLTEDLCEGKANSYPFDCCRRFKGFSI
jgi:hypothetical protein